ncbi:hypothetical protein BYT27DRAFT_7221358 [Phlegmacium glaucopus]|nr:hypothetical protein BYT27DRAFT_7221358 [Phlegmacium glaucopus]
MFNYPSNGLHASDMLRENFEKEAAGVGEKLSAYDCAICQAFSFKLQTNLTDKGFAMAPCAFNTDPFLPRIHKLQSCVVFLAAFKPIHLHCCPNSCCCYAGPKADLTHCPHCKEPQYQSNNKLQKYFTYIPIIPQLIAAHSNLKQAKVISYYAKHKLHHKPGIKTDIPVKIDGIAQPHKFFADD